MSTRQKVSFDSELVIYGGVYYFRGIPVGFTRRIERSLKINVGATQKEVAKAKKDFLATVERMGSASSGENTSRLMDKYVSYRNKEAENSEILSESSIRETRNLIANHLEPFFGSMKVEMISQKDFSDYCFLKSKKGLNLVNHRKVMNHFLKWCLHESYLKYRPELELPKAVRKKRRERIVLTDEEIKALIQASGPKLLLYVGFYLFMGMRNMEICKLRWDEIDFKNKALFINKKSNRTRKARSIPINGFVIELLTQRQKSNKTKWVFPSSVSGSKLGHLSPAGGIMKSWNTAIAKAGIKRPITPHDLRATFETHMNMSVNFTDTQREKMAGASIDVQKNIYTKMDADKLRGLEESVKIKGLEELLSEKTKQISGGKSGGKRHG